MLRWVVEHPEVGRAILKARQIFFEGVKWNVGDERSIMCKTEKWTPNSFPALPQIRQDHDIMLTPRLIDSVTNSCNI